MAHMETLPNVDVVLGGPARCKRFSSSLMPAVVNSIQWLDVASRCRCADVLHETCGQSPVACALRRVDKPVARTFSPTLSAAVCRPDGSVRLALCLPKVRSRLAGAPIVDLLCESLPFCDNCLVYTLRSVNCDIRQLRFSPSGGFLMVCAFRDFSLVKVCEFELDADGGPQESASSQKGFKPWANGIADVVRYSCEDELVLCACLAAGTVIVSVMHPSTAIRPVIVKECESDKPAVMDDCQRDPFQCQLMAVLTREFVGPLCAYVIAVVDCPADRTSPGVIVWQYSPKWIDNAAPGSCLCYSPSGSFLCVGCRQETILLNSTSGTPLFRLTELNMAAGNVVSALALRPRGDQVFGLVGDQLLCWQLPGQVSLTRLCGLAVLSALRSFDSIPSLPISPWAISYLQHFIK